MNSKPNNLPHIRECTNPACVFRFPVTTFDKGFERCPNCGESTKFIIAFPEHPITTQCPLPDVRISLLLDNLRSVFNVGSIFRSADGCGIVEHLYLCGTTPTPKHPKMAKTSLGAEKAVPWSYHRNPLHLAQQLQSSSVSLIALEMTNASKPFRSYIQKSNPHNSVFIFGNEVVGIDPELLEIADDHLHLPMHGIKESLNVAVAASIVCYSV